MKHGDAMWVKCDIDGHGRRWRLAVCRNSEWEGDQMIYFPLDDFEDYPENYETKEITPINEPLELVGPSVRGMISLEEWIRYNTLALVEDDSISAELARAMRNERDQVCALINQTDSPRDLEDT